MRKRLLLAAIVTLGAAPGQAVPSLDPEAQLARTLAGRVAGAPVRCVELDRVRRTSIIPDTAIVYHLGSTIYVNRPSAGADSLDRWDTMVNRIYSRSLCARDTVELIDPTTEMLTGLVFLGDFIPYRRVATAPAY